MGEEKPGHVPPDGRRRLRYLLPLRLQRLRLGHDTLQPEGVRRQGQEAVQVPKEARQKGQAPQVQQEEVGQEEVQENLLRGRLLSSYALLIFEPPVSFQSLLSCHQEPRVPVRGAAGGWHVLRRVWVCGLSRTRMVQ